ncbi:hypothetical protein Adt_32818 [Abeliophyllum distichum]|uniref:Uncharacterized protein n=1 Tax=Abeliophyllum distichum TaxID=126358 RepID=A0ABD1QUH4_9LAMI
MHIHGVRCIFWKQLHAFKRMHTMKGSKSNQKYDVYEFPLAVQVEVHTVLTPTPKETENTYIQGFYIPSNVPNPILDAYLVGEETNMETEMEIGQLDVKIDGVIYRKLVVEIDGVTDGMVTKLETGGQQQAVETEQPKTEIEMSGHLDVETEGVTSSRR